MDKRFVYLASQFQVIVHWGGEVEAAGRSLQSEEESNKYLHAVAQLTFLTHTT